MNYMQIDKTSISNGKGFRAVLWCAGCSLKCEGCFNPETWSFESGKLFDEDAKKYLFEQLSKPYIKGLTCSGGHPCENENVSCITELLKDVKSNFQDKDVWMYTGYTWDQIKNLDVINYIDVLVDGPYIESQRDITLPFRGSTNQRIIDVKKTLQQNEVVLLDI